MHVPPKFRPSDSALDRLIADHPLATLVSTGSDGFLATPLPLLLKRPKDGHPTLLGHFARSNPHAAALAREPQALAVFQGPHGYVSPSWLSDRKQAPTWNYATVHMRVRVTLDMSAEAAREAVDILTQHMERRRPGAWSVAELEERYEKLVAGIVAFRAEVLDITAKFKLGQNERVDVLGEMLPHVADRDRALHALMLEHNAGRLATVA